MLGVAVNVDRLRRFEGEFVVKAVGRHIGGLSV